MITMIFMIMSMTFLSKVIAAEGEHKASRALRHAAEVIADSPAALQVLSLREYRQKHTNTDTDKHDTKCSRLAGCVSSTKPKPKHHSYLFTPQLRYLQTLNSISAENNSTIIFPIPIDIMSHFMQNGVQRQPPTVPLVRIKMIKMDHRDVTIELIKLFAYIISTPQAEQPGWSEVCPEHESRQQHE